MANRLKFYQFVVYFLLFLMGTTISFAAPTEAPTPESINISNFVILIALLVSLPLAITAIIYLFFFDKEKKSARNWNYIKNELKNRYAAIHLDKIEVGNSEREISRFDERSSEPEKIVFINRKMIAIDALIEKAQLSLTERSRSYKKNGMFLYTFGVFLMLIAVFLGATIDDIVIYFRKMLDVCVSKDGGNCQSALDRAVLESSKEAAPWILLIASISKRIVVSSILVLAMYFVISTANSCFRESTILLHRRHLLRLVRLISYESQGKVDTKDLRDIFGVDHAATSGFDKFNIEPFRDLIRTFSDLGLLEAAKKGEKQT